MTSEHTLFVSTEELQKVVDSYIAANGYEDWKVTVSDKSESHLDQRWVVCEDRIVFGYGSNHMPTKSYFAFGIKDGSLQVTDSMNDEQLKDMLDQ